MKGIEMKNVIVVIGAGQIGQAIARRVGVGKHVLLADMRPENVNAAAEVLGNAGYEVSVATVDASSRKSVQALVDTATRLGDVTGFDPQSRSVWHGPGAGRVRQCHRSRWRGCRHRFPVWASPSPAHRRTE